MSDFLHAIGDTVRYTPDGIIVTQTAVVIGRHKHFSGRNYYEISGKNKRCAEDNLWPTREKILALPCRQGT